MEVQLDPLDLSECLEDDDAHVFLWGKSFPIELALFDRLQIPNMVKTKHFNVCYQLLRFPLEYFSVKELIFGASSSFCLRTIALSHAFRASVPVQKCTIQHWI